MITVAEQSRLASSVWYSPRLRTLSLLLAFGLSAALLLYPGLLGIANVDAARGPLVLLLVGIAGGFVHGVGFVPCHPLWRVVFGPAAALSLMVGSVARGLLSVWP